MTYPNNPLQQLIPHRVFKTKDRLMALRFSGRQDLAVSGGPVNPDPISYKAGIAQRFSAVKTGDTFGSKGGGWEQRWFKIELPKASTEEAGRRILRWDCQGETTVWIDGTPWCGIDVGHPYAVLPDRKCTLYLATGTWQTGIWCPGHHPIPDAYGCRFTAAYIQLRDEAAWKISHDYEALTQLLALEMKRCGHRPGGSFGYNAPYNEATVLMRRLLRVLDDACNVYDVDGLEALGRCLKGVYKEFAGNGMHGKAGLIGHSHLDLVWMWPEAAGRHKAVHTASTMLRLMERYPEFRYVSSQPALYEYIEQDAPKLMTQVSARIKGKRWEATGGMEVEADVTIPSGEALGRSFLYGQARFKKLRGGSVSKVLWIPDVFGYSNCLPQIAKLGGCEAFYTTKMTWSSVTKFPYSSLRWRGNDGSEVITHLTPCGYNGSVNATEIDQALTEYQQTDIHDELLMSHGYGDGAGGVTEDMLERARRFKSLAGMPSCEWTTAESFFDRLKAVEDRLPVYTGEMYLEYHRGTYTTQSQLKANYRAAERALLQHEAVRVVTGGKALGDEHWLRTLFVHFHDAIPGSSITRVYDELNPELQATVERELTSAAKELGKTGRNKGALVFNPLVIDRGLTVRFDAATIGADGTLKAVTTPDGTVAPVQKVGRGKEAHYLARIDTPALGSVRLLPSDSKTTAEPITATPKLLDNGIVKAGFNAKGQLASLKVRDRVIDLKHGELRLYPDHPANFDAWDIDRGTMALGQAVLTKLSLSVEEQGPVRAVLVGSGALDDKSSAQIRFVLEAGSEFLQIEIDADWQADHQLLKYHVVTGYQGRFARYGAPYGAVERPQLPGYHNDESQWEVAGQRWMTLGEDGSEGVAIVTEAKYGFSCREGDIGLSLLRAPTDPDPVADRGQRHLMRFAVGAAQRSGAGDLLSTAAQAESLYGEALVVAGGAMVPAPVSFEDLGTVVPSAIKPAEDGKGCILRFHETGGSSGSVVISLASEPKAVSLVDLLERPHDEGKVHKLGQRRYRVSYRAYQVVSLRIR
ncbi:MAG: glycosyl hydrolase-related protein [Planctomycetota bacterium]|jgi:alpha-mannosidase|nr:glycosyl hydrolase-related protein [Planctomycetota bacterium]